MILPCYAVSDAPAETIVDIAATVGASHLIVGAPQRSMIVNLLRGNIIRSSARRFAAEMPACHQRSPLRAGSPRGGGWHESCITSL
jgi:hypothetical protein